MLPTGSILDAVLVTVSAQGTAAYASISDTTSWTVHTEKDSINFTEPVIFRVMATDGKSYRDYRVTLNVRSQVADPRGSRSRQRPSHAVQSNGNGRELRQLPHRPPRYQSLPHKLGDRTL